MSSTYPPYGGPPAKRCQRCGAPLPPNVVTCTTCGASIPVAQSSSSANLGQPPWAGSSPQTSYGSGQYLEPQWGQAPMSPFQDSQWGQPPALPQNNVIGTPYPPQPMSSPDNFYGAPEHSQQSNFNNYYAMPQQNAYYSSPSGMYAGYSPGSLNGYAPAGFELPLQRKRALKVGLIIGIGLLVIILLGGAFVGYSFLNYNQNSTASNVTPTVLSTPSITPLFNDTFANNNTGWDLTSNPGKFSVKVGGGSMVLEDDDNKLLWEILPGKRFTDFRLDVNAMLSKGDPTNGYGVFIRGASSQNSDLGTYYRFEMYGDGTYAIFKGSLDAGGQMQSTKVQGYVFNQAIAKAGQVNHITITAKGPKMVLMVNGQTIYTYTDDNYKSGSIALFVSNLPSLASGAQATFTKLAIFPVS